MTSIIGRRIVVTRPRQQAGGLVRAIRNRGGVPLQFPTVAIHPIRNDTALVLVLKELDRYEWIVFTSVNGVSVFTAAMRRHGVRVNRLSGSRIAAIGPSTARALVRHGVPVDYVPEEYRAERIMDGMGNVDGAHILLARAAGARPALRELLVTKGAVVREVSLYETGIPRPDADGLKRMRAGIDAVTFTSSSTVEHFITMLADEGRHMLAAATVACIGPVTAETARRAGVRTDVIATTYTTRGLLDSLTGYFHARVSS